MATKNFQEESKLILKGFEKAYEKMVKFKKEKGTYPISQHKQQISHSKDKIKL